MAATRRAISLQWHVTRLWLAPEPEIRARSPCSIQTPWSPCTWLNILPAWPLWWPRRWDLFSLTPRLVRAFCACCQGLEAPETDLAAQMEAQCWWVRVAANMMYTRTKETRTLDAAAEKGPWTGHASWTLYRYSSWLNTDGMGMTHCSSGCCACAPLIPVHNAWDGMADIPRLSVPSFQC